MKNFTLWIAVSALFFFQTRNACAQDVLTQHNDLPRTGWDNAETQLDTTNVNQYSFGLLGTMSVDDQVFAQPLIANGLTIAGATHNVVFIATASNSIYAFDADNVGQPALWSRKLLVNSSFRPPLNTDMYPALCNLHYNDYSGNIGIVGTPVIDKPNGIMYVVSREVDPTAAVQGNHTNGNAYAYQLTIPSTGFYMYLHAINILTGAEMSGSPVLITANAPGIGDGSVGGVINLDPRRNQQRAGLVFLNGTVYIPFAAHCDWDNYHGWLLGYNYSGSALTQTFAFPTSPNDGRGGIWMSGAAPASDGTNLFFTTGNGHLGTMVSYNDSLPSTANSPSLPANRGESIVKLNPANSQPVADWYTPGNVEYNNDADLDFPMQVLLVPNTNILLTACKSGQLYLINKTNMGGFDVNNNAPLNVITLSQNAQFHSSFAYFGGPTPYVYTFSENANLQGYPVTGTTTFGTVKNGVGNGPTGSSGAYMAVSSNGTNPKTGVLWISHAENGCNANQAICPGILRAVSANSFAADLWNSDMNSSDNVGNFAKMSCPTIANGKVYLATFSNRINIYGLLASNTRCVKNVALHQPAASYTASSFASAPANAFDSNTNTFWQADNTVSNPSDQWLQVDLGANYNICKIIIDWYKFYASSFDVSVSTDGVNFTPYFSVTGYNPSDTYPVYPYDGTATGRYVRLHCSAYSSVWGNAYGYAVEEFQVLGNLANSCTAPTLGTTTNITTTSATLNWSSVSGATGYNIQYRPSNVASWVNRSTTGASSTSITLPILSCATPYVYQVQTICSAGLSSYVQSNFTTSACTVTCDQKNRFSQADVGDVGLAGSSCYTPPAVDQYAVTGSGSISGTQDAFQFAFTGLVGDEDVYAEVLSQDAASPNNLAGVMMRDVVTNTSRFAYVALTSANGAVFMFRSVDGGPITTYSLAGIQAPYWVRLSKTGSEYSAFVSPTVTGPFTQIGSTADAGFGVGTNVSLGVAVTSSNNSVLSTAVFYNLSTTSVALPIKLISFTAINMNNSYVSLQWATSMEQFNDHFEVQRSADGAGFTTIATVKSQGNSEVEQSYSAEDRTPLQGMNYYRLKQVDVNGNATYSQVVPVNFGGLNDPSIYPNPANSYFYVVAGKETINSVSLYDLSGKLIQEINNSSGASSINVQVAGLASGIYVVKIKTDSQTYQQKLNKL